VGRCELDGSGSFNFSRRTLIHEASYLLLHYVNIGSRNINNTRTVCEKLGGR